MPELTDFVTHGELATVLLNYEPNFDQTIYVTQDQLSTILQNYQPSTDLDVYATKTLMSVSIQTAISDKATVDYVDTQVASIFQFSGSYDDLTDKPSIPDLNGYATQTWTQTQLDNLSNSLSVAPQTISLNGTNLTISDGNTISLAGLIPAPTGSSFSGDYEDLTNKPEIPDLTGYATQSWTLAQINSGIAASSLDDQHLTLNGSILSISGGNSVDLSTIGQGGAQQTLAVVATSGDYEDLINKPEIPDLTGYATMTWVLSQLSSLSQIVNSGVQNIQDLLNVNLTNPSQGQALVYRNGLWVNESVSVDLTGYATQTYVDTAVAGVTVDLSNYYTKSEVDTAIAGISVASTLDDILTNGNSTTQDIITSGDFMTYAYVSDDNGEIISGVVTNDDWGFITDTATFSQDYGTITLPGGETGTLQPVSVLELANAYADAILANAGGSVDLTGYATKTYVDTAVAGVSVDLTGYATETYVNTQVTTETTRATAAEANLQAQIDSISVSGLTENTVNVTTTATTVVDSFAMSAIRSADYHITVSSETGFTMYKLSVIHDGTNVYSDPYSVAGTNTGSISVGVNGGNVELRIDANSPVTEVKFKRESVSNSGVHTGGGIQPATLNFACDLQNDTELAVDLQNDTLTAVDLQNDTLVCGDPWPGTQVSSNVDVTFPMDLHVDTYNDIDLTQGSNSMDMEDTLTTGTFSGPVQ